MTTHYEYGGLLVINAQNYTTYTPRGVHTWTAATYLSVPCMVAAGTNTAASGYSTTNAQLDYPVHFNTSGTYSVWLRCQGGTTTSDSVHVGINNTETASCDTILATVSADYIWRDIITDAPLVRATLTIPAPGLYTLNIWSREAGFRFAKIVLTLESTYNPGHTNALAGPNESATTNISAPGPSIGLNKETLSFYITASRDGGIIFDASAVIENPQWTWGEHGPMSFSGFVPCSQDIAQNIYDYTGTPTIEVYDGPSRIWIGLMTNSALTDRGIEISGIGVWSFIEKGAVPYTSFWSTTRTDSFFVMDGRSSADNRIGLHDFHNDNRVYIAAKKGVSIGNVNTTARYGFAVPHNSRQTIGSVFASFAIGMGDSFQAGLQNFTCTYPLNSGSWSNLSTMWSNATTGTGTISANTGATSTAIAFYLYRTVAPTVINAEPETYYAQFTNIRIKATNIATSISSSRVIGDIHTAIMSDATYAAIIYGAALIDDTTNDQYELVYEDIEPSKALLEQASLVNHKVFFDERSMLHSQSSYNGRIWYIDESVVIRRDTANIANSIYSRYRDDHGRILRTTPITDVSAVARYGITRYAYVDTETTSLTEANVIKTTEYDKRNFPPPMTAIQNVMFVRDPQNVLYAATLVRPGDTIVIRSISPTLGSLDKDQYAMTVLEVSAAGDPGTVTITPGALDPTMERLLAR